MTPEKLNELERLEKAATPGKLAIDKRNGDILTRGEWGCQTLLCYERLPMPGLEAQFRNPADREFWIALRNSAAELIADSRKLRKLEEAAQNCVNFGWGASFRKALREALEECLAGPVEG